MSLCIGNANFANWVKFVHFLMRKVIQTEGAIPANNPTGKRMRIKPALLRDINRRYAPLCISESVISDGLFATMSVSLITTSSGNPIQRKNNKNDDDETRAYSDRVGGLPDNYRVRHSLPYGNQPFLPCTDAV